VWGVCVCIYILAACLPNLGLGGGALLEEVASPSSCFGVLKWDCRLLVVVFETDWMGNS